MPGDKDIDNGTAISCSAFEFVSGTLTIAERREFERLMQDSAAHRAAVTFWEEQLLPLNAHQASLPPYRHCWEHIEKRISPRPAPTEARQRFSPMAWLQWLLPSAAAALLALVVVNYQTPTDTPQTLADAPDANPGPNIDYVAVLTNEEGEAVLTALTTGKQQRLWLKWEGVAVEPGTSLQLWARSRRDGEVRPLAVFDQQVAGEIPLTETTFRLITDSSFLLLTREEPGGSPLDEPSEALLARGFCVRLSPGQSAI